MSFSGGSDPANRIIEEKINPLTCMYEMDQLVNIANRNDGMPYFLKGMNEPLDFFLGG
ncbi:MAG TPA: hypothetical protein PK613_13270 [Anaerolineaceae bacterium]|nr:hypothetical protein [Anaerolineaceae bacterium]